MSDMALSSDPSQSSGQYSHVSLSPESYVRKLASQGYEKCSLYHEKRRGKLLP